MNAQDRRTAKDALADLRAGRVAQAIASLERLLPGKRGPRAVNGETTLKEDREARQQTHREETSELRAEVVKRADGWCECGCGSPLLGTGEWDHMQGGSGRRREQQTVENTWLLASLCHRAKTLNAPTAAFWWDLFDKHCEKYGYPILPHIEHAPLRAKAGP